MDQSQQGAVYSGYGMAEEDPELVRRVAILFALGTSLGAKRRDAVAYKMASGIETEWQGDEEHYQGYDNANRHEFVNTASLKSGSAVGQLDNAETRKPQTGSTVFPNITQPYVDAGAARVGDMLLPTDDRNFALEPTPIPDMFEGLEAELSANQPQPAAAPVGQPNQQVGMAGVPGSPMPVTPAANDPQIRMPDGAVMALSQAKQRFEAMKRDASRKAEKAQLEIDDYLTECQYHGELRKVIDDAAKLGSGVIKGPVPVLRKSRQWRRGDDGVFEMITVEEIKPASKRVDPWDLFPDPSCGESIHNGAFIFERDRLTGKKLEALIGTPGYIESEIRACLKEGPGRQLEQDPRNLMNNTFTSNRPYEIWYYHGDVRVEELEAAGCDCEGADPDSTFPAMMTMVNDRVIRASLNPLDDGDFPYDVIPWKRRPGMPWGMGIARQMRTPQRIVVAATRNLMDNAGLASGPQIVFRRSVFPENGVWEIVPLKFWIDESEEGSQSRAAVESIVIPMLQEPLMQIIQFGLKMAEDVTGLPMLLQGQQGAAPDTVGGLQILNNNANSVLRRIARLFDSSITEPHIRRYYAWLMEYGRDDDAKGDFQIVARGSSALVERDIQSQELVQVVQLCLNPAYGKNPAKAMDEYLKSRRFDPAAFDYTEEEKQEMANRQPPEDPRVTAANITAASNEKLAGIKQQGEQAKQQSDQAFKAGQSERDQTFQAAMAELQASLAQDEQAGKREISMDELKVLLATTAQKLTVQKELSMMNAAAQAAKPPTEPAGRAKAGHAYEQ